MAVRSTSARKSQISTASFRPQPFQHSQKTILKAISCQGIGIHSGVPTTMTLSPAPLGSGITFVRTDLGNALIKASWETVVSTQFCTTIGNQAGVRVSTIEHVLAALAASEVDNVRISLDGPEVPIMDGSAQIFLDLLDHSGFQNQQAPRQLVRVLKNVTVAEGDRIASLSPSPFYELSVDFNFLGQNEKQLQPLVFRPSRDSFRDLIGPARTFGRLEDAINLRSMGFAKGSSLENTVVYEGDRLLNETGLRYPDECARHKILDAMGDLHLSGGLILGKFHGVHAGHGLHLKLLQALFADPLAWTLEN